VRRMRLVAALHTVLLLTVLLLAHSLLW
jgi:hypothetical protein